VHAYERPSALLQVCSDRLNTIPEGGVRFGGFIVEIDEDSGVGWLLDLRPGGRCNGVGLAHF
jgi:hypothetical protein